MMLQVRQQSVVTSHRCTCTSFLENVFGLYFCHFFLLMKLYQCKYLSRERGLFKASDLLLGDHVFEKSDAVKRLSMAIIYMITSC